MVLPYHVIYPMLHVMYLSPPPSRVNSTDACENSTFCNFVWGGNKHYYKLLPWKLLPWNSFFALNAYADFTCDFTRPDSSCCVNKDNKRLVSDVMYSLLFVTVIELHLKTCQA